MTTLPIRVGFIGLATEPRWAAMAHVPALRSMPDRFIIAGVANTSLESAQRAARAYDIPHAFPDAAALVASPEIDLVVVTVKVPHHLALVRAALEAGKHVYCEWPLGNGLAEAEILADLADRAGVVAVAGTQALGAPEIDHLKSLVADGFVGEVLSVTLVGSGGNWAGETDASHAYLFDQRNGATMQSVALGHALAALREVLGELGPMSARFACRIPNVKLAETGEILLKTTPDQVMVHGTLASGAALSIHYRAGMSRGTNLLWEINGTEGDLQVTGDSGHLQIVQLAIAGARGDEALRPLPPPEAAYAGWPEVSAVRNVARLYARLSDDVRTGSRSAPGFRQAAQLHAAIDAIERSAEKA